jgi:hypothetical protein
MKFTAIRKKISVSFIFVLSVYFLAAQTEISAQTTATKAWTWSNYKIAFQAPNDLAVRENSATVFHAGNGNVFLNIYPKKGGNVPYDKMQESLQKWAIESKVNFSSSNSGYISNLNRFWGYYINGTSYRGTPVYLLLLVNSSNPQNSYYVYLQYKTGFASTALNVLKSFSLQ